MEIGPKILRDHFAVQASSIDSPEKQRLTIEKFLEENVHGLGATPMDVDALAKTKGGQVEEVRRQLFLVTAQKKAVGKPQVPKSPLGADPKAKGEGKGGKGKKGASSLDEWPDDQENPPSDEKATKEAAGLFVCAVSRHRKCSQRDWQAWERIRKSTHKSGNLVPMLSRLSWERESI